MNNQKTNKNDLINHDKILKYLEFFCNAIKTASIKDKDYSSKLTEFKKQNNIYFSNNAFSKENFKYWSDYYDYLILDFLNTKFNKESTWNKHFNEILDQIIFEKNIEVQEKKLKVKKNTLLFFMLVLPFNLVNGKIKSETINNNAKKLLTLINETEVYVVVFFNYVFENIKTTLLSFNDENKKMLENIVENSFKTYRFIPYIDTINQEIMQAYFVSAKTKKTIVKNFAKGLNDILKITNNKNTKSFKEVDKYIKKYIRNIEVIKNWIMNEKNANTFSDQKENSKVMEILKDLHNTVNQVLVKLKNTVNLTNNSELKQNTENNNAKPVFEQKNNSNNNALIKQTKIESSKPVIQEKSIEQKVQYYLDLLDNLTVFLSSDLKTLYNNNEVETLVHFTEFFKNLDLNDLKNNDVSTKFKQFTFNYFLLTAEKNDQKELIQILKTFLNHHAFSPWFEERFDVVINDENKDLVNPRLYAEVEYLVHNIRNFLTGENDEKYIDKRDTMNDKIDDIKKSNINKNEYKKFLKFFDLLYFCLYERYGLNLRNLSNHFFLNNELKINLQTENKITNLILLFLIYLTSYYLKFKNNK